MICKELNITKILMMKKPIIILSIYFYLKIKSNKLFANLYRFICRVYRINVVLNQIREIIFNKKYLKLFIKKIFRKINYSE